MISILVLSPVLSPLVLNLQSLSLCRSSSVSSEGTSAEEEKTEVEEEEEEKDKDVAAPVEELVAAAPPAAREVPAHLQKQAVRKTILPKEASGLYKCRFFVFTRILSSLVDPRGV